MSSDLFKAATTLLNMPLREKIKIFKDLLKNFLLETRVVCTLCHIEDRGHLPGGGGFHLRLYTISSRVENYLKTIMNLNLNLHLKKIENHLFKQ